MEAKSGEWERASAPRRGDGAVAGYGSAVASSGGQGSWRNEEEKSRVMAVDGERKGRENGESRGQARAWLLQTTRDGEVGHKQQAREATRQRHPVHGRTLLFIKFKSPILPQKRD